VLAAAVLVAVALVPMVVAYHQLGYDGDVRAVDDGSLDRATAYLDRAVANASGTVAGRYGWGSRDAAAAHANRTLETDLRRLGTVGLADDAVYRASQNHSAATTWAGDACPTGPMREFGPCRTDGGLVFQRRAGEAHLVAVALDLRVVADDRSTRLTVVVRGYGRRVSA
jgi:hypothetical protein